LSFGKRVVAAVAIDISDAACSDTVTMDSRTISNSVIQGWIVPGFMRLIAGTLATLACFTCVQGFAIDDLRMRQVTDPLSAQVLAPFAFDFATPADIGIRAEDVWIPNAFGNKLRAWYFPVDGAEHSIVICMGNTGNIACMLQYAKIFVSGGFNVLMFDYQGFGRSEGSASVLSLIGDASAAFDYMVNERHQPAETIGLFGVSLGSIIAMSTAADKGAGAVATEDLFLPSRHVDSFEKHFRDDPLIRFAIQGIRTAILPQVDPLQTVTRLNCPLFLLHGEHDHLLPPSATMEIAQASSVPTRVWIMDDVGHAPESLEANDLEFRDQLCGFFGDVFSNKMRDTRPPNRVTAVDGQYRITVSLDKHSVNKPIQICASNGRGAYSFFRIVPANTEPLQLTVPFPPSHVSTLVIKNATTDANGSWTPKLSVMSRDRADFIQLRRDFVRTGRVLVRDPQRNNRVVAWYFDADRWEDFRQRIPSPSDVHPRVRPRYARWLAMLEVYMKRRGGVDSLSAAELSVQFMPDEPEAYYQLDNAGFELGLTDPLLARTMTWLARRRLEEGQFEDSKRLLSMYLRIKPATVDAVVTEGHINAIDDATLPDLLPSVPSRDITGPHDQ
jgi:uncharacterized protein